MHQNSYANEAYIVIIEWDGQKPPSSWYTYLSSLTGGKGKIGAVKGWENRELDTVARRTLTDDATGIVVQEGCVICPSESLAETIASYARTVVGLKLERQPVVAIGKVALTFNPSLSPEVAPLISRVTNTLGKRGRKPPAQNWAVTCPECLVISLVNDSRPLNCPRCGGLRIHTMKGQPVVYRDDNSDILAFWLRTRFAGPSWQPCETQVDEGIEAPALADLLSVDANEKTSDIIDAIRTSPLVSQLDEMPRPLALAVLDAVFAARMYHSAEKRQRARVEAVTEYLTRCAVNGVTPRNVILGEVMVDLLDTALLLKKQTAVDYFMAYGL